MSWLRRNALALATAPLVLALAFHTADDAGLLEQWRAGRRAIAEHPPGATASWHGLSFRVDTVEVLTVESAGAESELPPGTQVVNVSVAIAPADPAHLEPVLCWAHLVDVDGHTYRAGPTDYHGGSLGGSCAAGYDDPAAGRLADYTFLLPDDATPRALRLGDSIGRDLVDLRLAEP